MTHTQGTLDSHYPILAKSWTLPPNLTDYNAAYANHDWHQVEKSMGLPGPCGYNIASRSLDDHPTEVMNRPALLWEGYQGNKETYTFAQLSEKTNQVANLLTALGIQSGDRVFIFLERIPELYMVMFGGLKVQAVMGPLFSAFGPEALKDRIQDCGAKMVITSPKLKPKLDAILSDCPTVETLLVVDREGTYTTAFADTPVKTVLFFEALKDQPLTFTVPYTPKDTYSIIHYTSGTTGKPKGVVHRHYSVVSQAETARTVMDLKPETDVYWCTADPGWVTGTSYGMFGPWALGTTMLVFEGHFSAEKWYQLLQDYGITVWYTAPTAIRMLMKAGDELPKQYDFSKLRHMLSVGEPLNPEAVMWGHHVLGHVFHDTWWQTETGCMHIVNFLTEDVKPGSMGKPHPGVTVGILDDDWNPLPLGQEGNLALRPEAPSMFCTYWNRDEVYQSRMKNGWYLAGDRAKADSDGYYWFFGRSDDVINTAGVLVGPFDVESVLIEHPAVAEAGVIGKPDPERMEIIKAFVSLKEGYAPTDKLREEIQKHVKTRLAAHAYPREIEFIDSLPKTRSGKIMRRLLKARELGLPEGDLSTLED